jgi:hypothetical protein
MSRLFLTIGAAVALASCGVADSDTLGKFGAYQKVAGPWVERTDPLVGPKKFLSYDTLSDDKRATLSLGCADKQFMTSISVNGAGIMLFDTKAVVETRLDDKVATEPFIVPAGKKDLRPGRATSGDAYGFIKSLNGRRRLGFRIRSLAGIETADLPLEFSVAGAHVVAHNLEIACKKSR